MRQIPLLIISTNKVPLAKNKGHSVSRSRTLCSKIADYSCVGRPQRTLNLRPFFLDTRGAAPLRQVEKNLCTSCLTHGSTSDSRLLGKNVEDICFIKRALGCRQKPLKAKEFVPLSRPQVLLPRLLESEKTYILLGLLLFICRH